MSRVARARIRVGGMLDPSLPRPSGGRSFSARRHVRLADMDATGRVRLDAVTRFLQDIAIDDVQETGWGTPDHLWFVRRIRLDVREPLLSDRELELVTWCSGVASIAAGRRWSVTGDRGGNVEVDSVWIHLGSDQRPARIESFGIYAEAADGRPVSTRLELPRPRTAFRGRRSRCGRAMSTSTGTSTTPSTGRRSRACSAPRPRDHSSPSSTTATRSTLRIRSSSPSSTARAASRWAIASGTRCAPWRASRSAPRPERRERVGDLERPVAEPEDLGRAAAGAAGRAPLARRVDHAAALEHPAQVRRRDLVAECGDVDLAQLGEREGRRREREAGVRVRELRPAAARGRRARSRRGRTPSRAGRRPDASACRRGRSGSSPSWTRPR